MMIRAILLCLALASPAMADTATVRNDGGGNVSDYIRKRERLAKLDAAFEADNVGGDMLGLGISLTRANLSVSVRTLDFTTGVLPAGVTFTRAGSATYFDSAGVMQVAAIDQPRLDYDPVTKVARGLLMEESRTNLLLNSATLSTQSVTTTAQQYTLTFYGTGSVTLSGTATGALAGTGANDRVRLTVTATAGTLALTVNGTVTNANLEAGAFPTSYIPTTTAAATRAVDKAVVSGPNFSRWFNPTEGTFFIEASGFGVGTNCGLLFARKAGATPRHQITYGATGLIGAAVVNDSNTVTVGGISATGAISHGSPFKMAYAYKDADFGITHSGAPPVTNTTAVGVPLSVSEMLIAEANNTPLNGHIRRIHYWPRRLTNDQLQGLTA